MGKGKKLVTNQRGVSIAAAIIGAAISLGVAVSLFRVINFSQQNQSRFTQNIEFELMRLEISRLVQNPDLCSTMLRKGDETQMAEYDGTTDIDLTQIMRVKTIAGTPVYQKIVKEGEPYGSSFTVENINLIPALDSAGNPIPPEIDTPNPGETLHRVQLIIEAKRFGSDQRLTNRNQPYNIDIVTVGGIVNRCDSQPDITSIYDICMTKRTTNLQAVANTSMLWCEASHPRLISCAVFSKDAPSSSLAQIPGYSSCFDDGSCNGFQSPTRSTQDRARFYEKVQKIDGGVTIEGCAQYSNPWNGDGNKLDIVCCR